MATDPVLRTLRVRAFPKIRRAYAQDLEPPVWSLAGRLVDAPLADTPRPHRPPPTLPRDRELARDLIQSWGALSHATHHHAYDLPPTATELEHWLAPVAELINRGPDA